MDCSDLFKKAAAALQTDPRYLELDAARRENDSDEELQNLIGELNLARLDLNNESAKAETNAAHDRAGPLRRLHRQLLHLRRLPLNPDPYNQLLQKTQECEPWRNKQFPQ